MARACWYAFEPEEHAVLGTSTWSAYFFFRRRHGPGGTVFKGIGHGDELEVLVGVHQLRRPRRCRAAGTDQGHLDHVAAGRVRLCAMPRPPAKETPATASEEAFKNSRREDFSEPLIVIFLRCTAKGLSVCSVWQAKSIQGRRAGRTRPG